MTEPLVTDQTLRGNGTRYVLLDPGGAHCRLWGGAVGVAHWEHLEDELVSFPSLIEAEAVATWIRGHDLSLWRPAPHPRDCPAPALPAERQAAKRRGKPRRRRAAAAGAAERGLPDRGAGPWQG